MLFMLNEILVSGEESIKYQFLLVSTLSKFSIRLKSIGVTFDYHDFSPISKVYFKL